MKIDEKSKKELQPVIDQIVREYREESRVLLAEFDAKIAEYKDKNKDKKKKQ